MTDLSDILSPDAVEASLAATSKKSLLQLLAGSAARATGLPVRDIAAAVAEREKLGSTGFGGGVAIPHGRLAALPRITGCFARLPEPVAYQSVDQMPVDLVFLLLSPTDAGADHLKALARVSRVLRDRQMLAKLRGARSRDALYALLAGAEARDAA
jgi:nitrogen PTS system EIIA component